MGMFDDFKVAKDNKVKIVYLSENYQSKQFGCTLAQFAIDVDGKLGFVSTGNDYAQAADDGNELTIAIKSPEGYTGSLHIYGLDGDSVWYDYILYVKNNQIVFTYEEEAGLAYVSEDCNKTEILEILNKDYAHFFHEVFKTK